jgi:hypothetical protein
MLMYFLNAADSLCNKPVSVVCAKCISIYSIMDQWTLVREIPSPYMSSHLCFNFSARDMLAISDVSNALMIYNCSNDATLLESERLIDQDLDLTNSISFNHNGSLMAVAGSHGMIKIFDCITWTPILPIAMTTMEE